MDKSGANSVESTHGSSGAAKYLINQLHLRPPQNPKTPSSHLFDNIDDLIIRD